MSACMTAKRGWLSGMEILSFDDAGVTPHSRDQHALTGCTADAALLHEPRIGRYLVCADQCRPATVAGVRASSVSALAGDRVVAVLVRDQVLGVWSEQGPPTYYNLGKQVTPVFALSDGKVIDIAADGPDGPVIVRVPAK